MKEHPNIKHFLINLLGIAIIAVLLSNVSFSGCVSSLAELQPAGRSIDFESSDFYQLVADSRAEKTLDDQIVIIPIDTLSRQGIRQLLDDLSLCEAKAIGLDVFFTFPMGDDDLLMQSLRSTPGLVTVMGAERADDHSWRVLPSYLLDSLDREARGLVNMNISKRYQVVRDFVPFYTTDHGEISHFVISLARQVNPDVVVRLRDRLRDQESAAVPLYCPSLEFDTISPSSVLERIDDIEGRVVLIGALNDMQDVFITPVSDTTPGVIVHAYALSTVLHEQYADTVPTWVLWLIGLFIAAVFVTLKMWLKRRSLDNLLLRSFQALAMFLIVWLGCWLFIRWHLVLELTLPLLIAAFSLAALEVWEDIFELAKKILQYMKNHLFSRFFVLLLFVLSIVSLQAATYRVHKYVGDVRLFKNGEWVSPSPRQQVSPRDVFLLGDDAQLAIVVSDTRRIYYNVRTGKQNVAQLISEARKQSDQLASNIRQQLADKSSEAKSRPIFGGVNRGDGPDGSVTSYLYRELSNFLAASSPSRSDTLSLVTASIVSDADSYHFVLTNHSDSLLYTNIVRLPATAAERPTVCLEVGYTTNEPYLTLAPHQHIDLTDYTFLNEEQACRYLLFATTKPYDCQALKMMLNMSPAVDDTAIVPPATVFFYPFK